MSISTSLWPRQAKPGPKSFDAWNKLLREFHIPGSSKLRIPLGEWLFPSAPSQERQWPFAYDPDTDMLFERLASGTCNYYENYETTRRELRATGSVIADGEPDVSIPIEKLGEKVFSHNSQVCALPRTKTSITTWEDYVSQLDDWEADMISAVECPSIATVADALQQSDTTILLASDGGAAYGHGSFGWIICHNPEHVIARHKGLVRGYPISSRRAEGYGGLSLARFLFHVLSFFGITSFGVDMRWYCDSRDIIKRFQDYQPTPWNHYSHKLQGDDDVIMQLYLAWVEIEALRDENANGSPLQIIHVKSHQDETKPYEKLNNEAKCNYQSDLLATMQLQCMDKTQRSAEVIDLPAARIYFALNGQTITSQIQRHCLEALPRQELNEYMEQKFHWNRDDASQYDWENFAVARRTARPGMQVFITKLMFRLLPTAAREKRINLRECDKCQQCGEVEDIQHLFQCYKRGEWLPTLAFAVNSFCHKKQTKKSVREYLKQVFNEFKKGENYATNIFMELICGLVRNTLVEEFGPLSDERNQWVRGLIRIFWEYAFRAWDQRNKFIHTKTSPTGGRERENIISSVKKLFAKSIEMSEVHRSSIYPTDMEEFLKKSNTLLQDWVLRNTQAIKLACENYTQESISNTKTLENYFQKKTFEVQEHHPLSDEDEDEEETQQPEGEFRRMLRMTRLLSYFPRMK